MDNKKKVGKCYNARWWKNYKLGAWINKRDDGSFWFNYEIQRSIFLGKDKPKGQQYENQALKLNRLEDLCYLKTIIRFLAPKTNDKQLKKNHYVANKIFNEEEKKTWVDKEKPTKQEAKKALQRTCFYSTYTDKDGKLQKTNGLNIYTSELDILRDFVNYCINEIYDIYTNFEKWVIKKESGSNYQDNIDQSSNSQDDFVDNVMDDEIPF